MKNIRLIIWDWNGTIFDDINACICSINYLLEKRNMKTIKYAHYRDIFTFPVKKYYEKLGFDFAIEPFSKLASEYIALYNKESMKSNLHTGAIQVLNYFKINNIKQIIISAMEQGALKKQIKENKIEQYFEDIIGLNNIHAESKIENARNYLKKSKKENNIDCILIGDTYHDYEVSKALNCKCILFSNGHQNLNKLKFKGNVKIVNSLFDIRDEIIIN